MKHEITTKNFIQQLLKFKLAPGESVQNLIIAMAQGACPEGGTSKNSKSYLIVKIDIDLVSASYQQVPAMFARSFQSKVPFFPAVQSWMKNGQMVWRGGQFIKPTTFKARVLRDLREQGASVHPKKDVPASYRIRPSMLASVLSLELGTLVCNSCKEDRIRWYVKKH